MVRIDKLNLKLYGSVKELKWLRRWWVRTKLEDLMLPEIEIYYKSVIGMALPSHKGKHVNEHKRENGEIESDTHGQLTNRE